MKFGTRRFLRPLMLKLELQEYPKILISVDLPYFYVIIFD